MGLYDDVTAGIEDVGNTVAGTAEPAFDATTPDTGPWLRDSDGNDVFQGGLFDEDPLWERTDANQTVVQHDDVQNAADAAGNAVDEVTGGTSGAILALVAVLVVAYILRPFVQLAAGVSS